MVCRMPTLQACRTLLARADLKCLLPPCPSSIPCHIQGIQMWEVMLAMLQAGAGRLCILSSNAALALNIC